MDTNEQIKSISYQLRQIAEQVEKLCLNQVSESEISTVKSNNANRHWNPKDEKQLKLLLSRGESVETIAFTLGRSIAAILSRSNLLANAKRKKVVVEKNTVKTLPPEKPSWSDEEIQLLKEGWESGEKLSSLGGGLDRSVHSIRCKVYDLQKKGLLNKRKVA